VRLLKRVNEAYVELWTVAGGDLNWGFATPEEEEACIPEI